MAPTGQNYILWTEFNFVNKMLFRVMKPILSTKSKQACNDKYFLSTELKCPGVCSINAKNLLELALEGLDNKTNVLGMLSSFRLYSSVALPDLPGARPYSRVGYIPQFHARCR